MKFCVYCGKQLEDNEVCGCPESQPAPAPQPTPQPAPQPVPQPVPQPAPSPYSQAGQGEVSQAFGKAFKNTPVLFGSFWKNPENATSIAKREKDFAISGIFSGIFFIALLLYNVFFMTSVFEGADVSFGKMLGSAIVMTVVVMALYIFAIVLCEMFMVKKNFKASFLDAFIDFSIKSLPASILLVITGISGYISSKILFFLLLVVLVYFVVISVSSIIKSAGTVTDSFLKTLVLVAIVTVALVAVCYFSVKMFGWSFDVDFDDFFGMF